MISVFLEITGGIFWIFIIVPAIYFAGVLVIPKKVKIWFKDIGSIFWAMFCKTPKLYYDYLKSDGSFRYTSYRRETFQFKTVLAILKYRFKNAK